jgi:hypothetical protein
VLQVVGHRQAPYYAIPPLIVLAVTPVPWETGRVSARRARILSTAVLAIALALGAGYAARQVVTAGRTDAADRDRKRVSEELARAIHEQGGRLVIDDFYFCRSWMTAMETFYRYGELPLPAGLWTPFPSYWPVLYPGLSPEAVCRAVYEEASRSVDVAFVQWDPPQPGSRLSAMVSHHVSTTLRNDPRWERIRIVESAEFGPLAVYRRRTPPPGNYTTRLRSETAAAPQETGE